MRLKITLAKTAILGGLLASLLITSPANATDFCAGKYKQADLNSCTAKALAYEDKQLNQTYKEFRTLLTPQEKEQLKKVQLLWIEFRDKSCDFQLRDVEKSIYPMIMNNCQTKYTEARRQELAIEIDRLQ